jgi:hypothetical protein
VCQSNPNQLILLKEKIIFCLAVKFNEVSSLLVHTKPKIQIESISFEYRVFNVLAINIQYLPV